MPPRFRRYVGAAYGLAAMLVVACGISSQSAPPSAIDTVTVEAVESRNLSADGNLGVAVTNTGDTAIDIAEITLTAPPFPASSTVPRGRLDPGRTLRYAVPQGEPDCASLANYPDDTVPDHAYTLDITVGTETATAPVRRPDVFRRIGDRVCGLQSVLAVVDVTFGPPTHHGQAGSGATIDTTVELTRRGGATGAVDVTAVRGTPQFAMSGVGEPPLTTLGPDDDTASAEVSISALRCDAHVLAEGKKNYTFGVFLSLDGAPDALVEIPAPDHLHAALLDACDVH